MANMKGIVVTAPGVVQVREDIPIPVPGDYEVLCRVHACGICNGTDFQIINGTMGTEAGFQGYPTVLGHEGAGEIIALGSKVRYLKVGQRCIHANLRPEVGNGYKKTFGGMAEYGLGVDYRAMLEDGVVDEQALPFNGKFHTFPDEISYEDGALILSLSECNSAVKNFGINKGSRVLIYGAGPMGMGLARFMRLAGASHITTVDMVADRLERTKRVAQVDRILNASLEEPAAVLADEQFDFVVDAVGSSKILIDGSYFLRPGGKVCSLGVLKKADSAVAVTLMKNNTMLHMLNQPFGEYAIMDATISHIIKKEIFPKDFYSHVIPVSDIDVALELVRTKTAMKVVLSFE